MFVVNVFVYFSGAGETKPFVGNPHPSWFGFPLVFFVLAAHFAFDPTFKLRTFTQASRPHMCFLFVAGVQCWFGSLNL